VIFPTARSPWTGEDVRIQIDGREPGRAHLQVGILSNLDQEGQLEGTIEGEDR
jgi:hypothetical protein